MQRLDIQILGPTGCLGAALVRAAKQSDLVHLIETSRIDIVTIRPDQIYAPIVINAAGLVPQRSTSALELTTINTTGPQKIAAACDESRARLIHVSTDCVFSSPGPHSEDSHPDPKSLYGLSKLAGEVSRFPHVTVRCSFVGFSDVGLMGRLVAATPEHPEKASHRLLWNGNLVDEVARLILMVAVRKEISGLLHLPGAHTTRFKLAQSLARWLELDPAVVCRDDSFVEDRRLASTRWRRYGLPYPERMWRQYEAAWRPENVLSTH